MGFSLNVPLFCQCVLCHCIFILFHLQFRLRAMQMLLPPLELLQNRSGVNNDHFLYMEIFIYSTTGFIHVLVIWYLSQVDTRESVIASNSCRVKHNSSRSDISNLSRMQRPLRKTAALQRAHLTTGVQDQTNGLLCHCFMISSSGLQIYCLIA